jgi:hypothetical protein
MRREECREREARHVQLHNRICARKEIVAALQACRCAHEALLDYDPDLARVLVALGLRLHSLRTEINLAIHKEATDDL